MAEMKIDHLSKGAVRINPQIDADDAFKASLKAAADYMKKQKTHDMATWTRDQWEMFVWEILSNGMHRMIEAHQEAVQKAWKEIDEIPY